MVELGVWQIKAGQVGSGINPNTPEPIRLEEQLDVIVQAYIKTERDIDYVYVTWIAIKIAVRDTKRKLAPPNRSTVVNCEKSGWPTFWTARAY
jgi:hypothetical protein